MLVHMFVNKFSQLYTSKHSYCFIGTLVILTVDWKKINISLFLFFFFNLKFSGKYYLTNNKQMSTTQMSNNKQIIIIITSCEGDYPCITYTYICMFVFICDVFELCTYSIKHEQTHKMNKPKAYFCDILVWISDI